MMLRILKGKIHRAVVTDADLNYEGSVTVDRELLNGAGILPHEAVSIYNITNGARLETYALASGPGSGIVCINGAAAHLCRKGDLVIICAYAFMDEAETASFRPRVVLLEEGNRIRRISRYTPNGEHETDC